MELVLFGRTSQSRGGGQAGGDNLSDIVEVAGAHFALMLGRTVAMLFGRELRLLQFRIGLHSSIVIASRELKHAVIERVETGQGNELEFVTHRAELALKLCDLPLSSFFLQLNEGEQL